MDIITYALLKKKIEEIEKSSGVQVGVVSNGSIFPVKRPDGNELQNGDYVTVDPSSTFPFTIGSIEFTKASDSSVYFNGTWSLSKAGAVTSVNGKIGAVELTSVDIHFSDGTTIEQKFDQLETAISKAEQYKTQAGNYALQADASKKYIEDHHKHFNSLDEYIAAQAAGLILPNTISYIYEPDVAISEDEDE